MTATIHPLIDGALYCDPRTVRQQLVDEIATHIFELGLTGCPQDAFNAIMFSQRYDITSAAMCFKDALYLAEQMVIAKEMGLQ